VYVSVYMHVCAFEWECVYMHMYKHLHGISLRQTAISCSNTAPQCNSNLLVVMFILTSILMSF
jgi:hypothetical protein